MLAMLPTATTSTLQGLSPVVSSWRSTSYPETRVWGSNLALDDASGPQLDSTCRTHWRFTHSYGDLASGSSINGNRLSGTNSGGTSSGTYDAQDRMTAYGAATYTYGPSGDLRTKTAGGQTTTFSYDALGNLMGAWLPDGRVIEYVVDALNRRVGKKVNGALVEGFLYDGQLRPIAWLDGTGAVKATFVYGLHVNVPEYMTTSAGTFRILTDHLGSPRLVVDTASGAVVQRMDYDSFGQVLQDTASGFQPFGFAGGLWDRDTGLLRFGRRDYDSSVGRWTNKDPILFAGSINIYAYVGGGPISRIDPNGLTAIAFDPTTGTLSVDPEVEGRSPYSMPASSGRPNCGCDASSPGKGPIPSGSYTLASNEMDNPGWIGDILRNGKADWGDWRVALTPDSGTNTFGRSGFYLHGGSRPGSAGCIDVGGGWFGNSQTDRLLQDILSDPDGHVPVVVK
jgi:RHS repeat-associated protein